MDTSRVLLVSLDTETRGYSEERARLLTIDSWTASAPYPGVAPQPDRHRPADARQQGDGYDCDAGVTADASSPAPVSFNNVNRGNFATLGHPRCWKDGTSTHATRKARRRWRSSTMRWRGAGSARARRLAGASPVPRRTGRSANECQIVGVAANASTAHRGNQDCSRRLPIRRCSAGPDADGANVSSGDPGALAPAIRDAVRSLDGAMPVFAVRDVRIGVVTGHAPAGARYAAGVSGALGALVLVLSTVGSTASSLVHGPAANHGARSGSVSRSGPPRGRVAGLFLRQSVRWAAIGSPSGTLLAAGAAQARSARFSSASARWIASTFGGVIAAAGDVTAAASYRPRPPRRRPRSRQGAPVE